MNKTFSQHQPNNKLPALFYLVFAFIFLLIITFSSCKAKPIISTQTSEKIVEIKKDSLVFSETNKQILDSLFIAVSEIKTNNPDCDILANQEVKRLLKQLNTQKISGDNEYKIYYDEIKKMLVAYVKISETKNKNTEKNTSAYEKKSSAKMEKIPVKYIPKWVQIFTCIGFLFIGYLVVKMYNKFKPV